MNDVTCKLLKFGKKRIQNYGWVQRKFGDSTTGFCILGSMGWSHLEREAVKKQVAPTLGEEDYLEAMEKAERTLERSLPPRMAVVKFNDDPTTRKEDVLALFEAAIKRCKRGQGHG